MDNNRQNSSQSLRDFRTRIGHYNTLTEWLFVPMEPCPLRDEMLCQLDEQIEAYKAEYQPLLAQAGINLPD